MEPFNIDEDGTFYDVPPTTPTTLTDKGAGYGEPSQAAIEFIAKLTGWDESDEQAVEWAIQADAFAAQAVAAREAQYNALKAVADKMAVAARSVKSDAVYDSAYEDGDGNEYPAYAVDSDYMNTLYQTLREYEQVTDPAPKISK